MVQGRKCFESDQKAVWKLIARFYGSCYFWPVINSTESSVHKPELLSFNEKNSRVNSTEGEILKSVSSLVPISVAAPTERLVFQANEVYHTVYNSCRQLFDS